MITLTIGLSSGLVLAEEPEDRHLAGLAAHQETDLVADLDPSAGPKPAAVEVRLVLHRNLLALRRPVVVAAHRPHNLESS